MKKKILFYLRCVFFPSFSYQFTTSLVDLSYSEKLRKRLENIGATFVARPDDIYVFKIKTSQVLGGYRLGEINATVNKIDHADFSVSVTFVTQKYFFYVTIIFISLLLILSSGLRLRENMLTGVLLIPILFFSGHLYFWGSIAANIEKIKKFFVSISEG